jgi:hypothetical protein
MIHEEGPGEEMGYPGRELEHAQDDDEESERSLEQP